MPSEGAHKTKGLLPPCCHKVVEYLVTMPTVEEITKELDVLFETKSPRSNTLINRTSWRGTPRYLKYDDMKKLLTKFGLDTSGTEDAMKKRFESSFHRESISCAIAWRGPKCQPAVEFERELEQEQKKRSVDVVDGLIGMSGKRRSERGKIIPQAADVLSGRGNRVLQWPGNIYFRQIIDQYRPDYMGNEKNYKKQVANDVKSEITNVGGRFLTEAKNDGVHEAMSAEKSNKKIIQALRDRNKWWYSDQSNPFPFQIKPLRTFKSIGELKRLEFAIKESRQMFGDSENSSADEDASASSSRVKKKQKTETRNCDDISTTSNSSSRSGSTTTSSSNSSMSNSDSSDDDETVSSEDQRDPRSYFCFGRRRDAVAKRSWSNLENMKDPTRDACFYYTKLQQFIQQHGHCAIPPILENDQDLADWAVSMRSMREQVSSGNRKATSDQRAVFVHLDRIGFCCDYGQWHWSRQFKKLQTEQKQKQEQQEKQSSAAMSLSPESKEWLTNQRLLGWPRLPAPQVDQLLNHGIWLGSPKSTTL